METPMLITDEQRATMLGRGHAAKHREVACANFHTIPATNY
jgi:hypothetical protein